MNRQLPLPPPVPKPAISRAITALASASYRIEPADGPPPGIYRLTNCPELTTGQVTDLARQKGLI